MNWMIKLEDVSKMYRLGLVGSATLQDDFKRFWFKTIGKEDPFLKIGEENNRNISGGNYVWALKDINFEVKQGEVLGIIGKNGAGKSTLLKLLSKVTKPTTGFIKTRGRIASLLEVGTGFHPELTGRENIFLNGAILGMKKHEIKAKFDQIVDFSGCERYIDTPVKRYSSGMYVRLAFAVAAHLDPEILVVDEVLAVGDAEFQQKAIGKMKDVSQGEGRTVLFVSHNMESIKSLCNKALLMENGMISKIGISEKIIDLYKNKTFLANSLGINQISFSNPTIAGEKNYFKLLNIDLKGLNFSSEKDIEIFIDVEIKKRCFEFQCFLTLSTANQIDFLGSTMSDYVSHNQFQNLKPGIKKIKCTIPSNVLSDHDYFINLNIRESNISHLFFENIFKFRVTFGGYNNIINHHRNLKKLTLRPLFKWEIN